MIKIACCVITKGDEDLELLKGLLNSVRGIFNSIHITANGKETKEVKKFCKKSNIDYSFLAWNKDFSEQRNFNFGRVPKETDYIFWADVDDIVINAHLLPEIARKGLQQGLDTIYFEYWYGSKFNGKPSLETFVEVEIKHNRERLIKPNTVTWKKRLHESPIPNDGENHKYSSIKYSEDHPIAWLHLGADRDISFEKMKVRMDRNREILELELEDEKKVNDVDPRTLLYLMKIYTEEEDKVLLKKCIGMGQEYISKSGWDEERAVCYRLMATCMGKLGDHKKAKSLLHMAIEEYPYDPTLYLHLARAYFNLRNYGAMKHWMEIGLSKDTKRVSMENSLELKTLSAQLMLQYYYYGDEKNITKAYLGAKALYDTEPTKENESLLESLYDQKELDNASRNIHQYMLYLKEIDKVELIPNVYKSLPEQMKILPFANFFYNKYKEPKVWADNEICYYASFGTPHFEQFGPANLKTGIGGSETAVIQLAKEWTKKGYKVTVYCDCGSQEGEHEGVIYRPYYEFNTRDYFNVLIQWRSNHLVGKINAKKYLIDLHDVFYGDSYKGGFDALMVKSKYQRDLAPKLNDGAFRIVGNGI